MTSYMEYVCAYLDDTIILWELNQRADFVARICIGFYYVSLEGLLNFLAFLFPKLWPKNKCLLGKPPLIP